MKPLQLFLVITASIVVAAGLIGGFFKLQEALEVRRVAEVAAQEERLSEMERAFTGLEDELNSIYHGPGVTDSMLQHVQFKAQQAKIEPEQRVAEPEFSKKAKALNRMVEGLEGRSSVVAREYRLLLGHIRELEMIRVRAKLLVEGRQRRARMDEDPPNPPEGGASPSLDDF